MRYLLLFLLLIPVAETRAQQAPYASAQNPLYWKNRKPDPAYWQQDVHYTIAARMDEKAHRIDATEQLEYTNNSPDTLHEIFFHLYQNAFVKGSYLHRLEEQKGGHPTLGKHEAAGEGTIVSDLRADGQPAATALDNTILKVTLPKPLLPNQGVTLSMTFKTWYDSGSTRRRMQMYDAWGWKHYNGCQWFPKVCVYDRKFGWDTYQHLNKEFYGDFGVFDVNLDFPNNYIVEATGAIQNREEVLPARLREQLDIKNFAGKKWDEAPSVIIPYDSTQRKVWKYHAENVHDFAFTADPSYRISTTYWNGIECVGICQEPHASGWQNSAAYVAAIIQMFSQDIGMYAYPKMVAADAADGMEYPMLTLDGGRDPGYRGLLVHEIGHNWFYGMVGSNETYRAAMDEGFTQFLTAWGLSRLEGRKVGTPPKSRYRRGVWEPTDVVDANIISRYTLDALQKTELPLNTHSNDFHDALGHEGGYRQVYFKTATMLYNLQYTLGDSLFQSAMQHYFDQWKFAHPYFEDFRASIIQYTHADLNWFFDEWLETTKTIDYSVGKIRHRKGDNWDITFHRKGLSQMPVEFTVTSKSGYQQSFYIPNTWFSKAGTDRQGDELGKWYGWSKINPAYTASIAVPGGLRRVQIDTSYRLADRYLPDNVKARGLFGSFAGVRTQIDRGLTAPLDRKKYRLYLRPDLWWNPIDGIKAGIHAEGDYLNTVGRLDANIWLNTHVLQYDRYLSYESEDYYDRYFPVNYSISYATPFTLRFPRLTARLHSRFLDGLWLHRAGLALQADDRNQVQLYFQSMLRPNERQRDYLILPEEWSSFGGRPNNSLNFSWANTNSYDGGVMRNILSLRAPFLSGNKSASFNYAYAQLEHTNVMALDKLELRTRFFGRYGTGTQLPYESLVFAGSANPEELMDNKYTRSNGFVPDEWQGTNRYEPTHFQQGGGLNLRGYAGYFMADERNGETLIAYKARSGAAFNAELDVDGLIKLLPKLTKNWLHLDAYLFGDAGIAELSRYNAQDFSQIIPTDMWSDLRLDAGLGLAFTIKKFGIFDKAKPLTLRMDFPLLLNRPPYANPAYFGFRYVVGVNRAF